MPDACSLIDDEEISAVMGWEVDPGEAESTPEDASSCRFKTVPGPSTSTSYDAPERLYGSVLIAMSHANPGEFDEFEGLLGDEAEPGRARCPEALTPETAADLRRGVAASKPRGILRLS